MNNGGLTSNTELSKIIKKKQPWKSASGLFWEHNLGEFFLFLYFNSWAKAAPDTCVSNISSWASGFHHQPCPEIWQLQLLRNIQFQLETEVSRGKVALPFKG